MWGTEDYEVPLKHMPPSVEFLSGCQDKQNQAITLTSTSLKCVRHWQGVTLGKERRCYRRRQEGGEKSVIINRNKSTVSTRAFGIVLSVTFSSLRLPRALQKSFWLLHTRVEGFHWHISTRVLEMPESQLSTLLQFSYVHIAADKGVSSGGGKHSLSQCSSSVFQVSG